MGNAIKFCPHCGENVQLLSDAPSGVPAAAGAGAQEVVRREVTAAEKDLIWGLLQLPLRLIPIGVLSDSAGETLALVLEDPESRLWLGSNGEVKMLGDIGIPGMPPPPPENGGRPATVPNHPSPSGMENNLSAHICRTSAGENESRGQARYGSRG